MLKFKQNDILVDEKYANRTLEWYSSDDKKSFRKNGDNPYTFNIEYSFNSKGYRTKEISDVDKDFILVMGCSYTEGVGLRYDHIWCDILCKKLGIDHLNLSKSSVGPDIIYLNSYQYIKNEFPIPKMVIFQWPQNARKFFAYKHMQDIVLKHYSISNLHENKKDMNWYKNRYCKDLGEMTISNYLHYNVTNNFWRSINVPVFNWTWQGDFEPPIDAPGLYPVVNENSDKARDMQHDGPLVHQEVADKLEIEIKKVF